MSVYIGIDEDESPDDAGCEFTNYAFWNLKEKIYETLTKEEASQYSLFIMLMNNGEVAVKDLDELQVELKGMIAKFADEDSQLILNDISKVVEYCIKNNKIIVMG